LAAVQNFKEAYDAPVAVLLTEDIVREDQEVQQLEKGDSTSILAVYAPLLRI
jgi:hypothetical protein